MPVLPTLVAHADWSKDPKKRWMAVATRAGTSDRYLVEGPENVTDASTMIERLLERGNGGPILVGFDFPIGIPRAYAEKAGVRELSMAP